MVVRAGIGFDAHRFAEGRRLVLGGVEIDHPQGLAGHSDADVVLHSIADALLGAAALGDIGRRFPPDDPRWAGADSVELLRDVVGHVRERGWRVENVDVTVVAEAPRIGPYVERMTARIASALGVEPAQVSVKATTLEGMGSIGREEGIAAMAVATVSRNG